MVRKTSKKIGLWVGLVSFLIVLVVPFPEDFPSSGQRVLAVALLMIVWWIAEVVPIYMTAFLPVILFPFLGIMTSAATARNYGHNYVLMLLGAFILAKAIEKQGLHKRMALFTITILGSGKRAMVLGFMVATAFLSMWITNMAVVLIMLPVATALIQKLPVDERHNFGLALLLGIAYAASIGGTGTLIGTPPNMVFAGLFNKLYPDAPEIDFFQWMKIGIPVVTLFVPLVWFYLVWFFKVNGKIKGGAAFITAEQGQLGRTTIGEKRVLLLFLFTALGWIFKSDLILGALTIPGWSTILGISDFVHDSTVAMLGAFLLFVVGDGQGFRLMDWKTTQKIPWGVAMFLGGGLALGAAFKSSGAAFWLGSAFPEMGHLHSFWIVVLVVTLIVFVTEVNSNTATATIFLPLLGAIAVAGEIHPLLIMIPATFACSFAFMLPSGTGTNTVIFASDRITVGEMAKTGLWLNLVFILLLSLLLYFFILPVLGIDASVPEWAGTTGN
ncbi:SLC13 family permease [Maribacter sp. 2-571]|uniref:SLC13 family permease n=1 Tax=Maribacter sp. 2-571 TaxID=3417569 RepID=UPI003D32B2F5